MFICKAEEAITSHAKHMKVFEDFNAALPTEDTAEWLRLVEAWERDGKQPNLFATKVQKISENAVRLKMAEEDAAQLWENLTTTIHEDVSPSQLIAQGLELEDHQHILKVNTKALGPHSTDLQHSKIIERGNRLFQKIEAWISIQMLYIPQVAILCTRDDRAGSDKLPSTTNVNLYLPLALLSQGLMTCNIKFVEYEFRVHYAQAHSVLHTIQRGVLLCSQMWKSKDKLICGQRLHMCSHAPIMNTTSCITTAAQKYKEIQAALAILGAHLGKVGWDLELQAMTEEDTWGITADEDNLSEGRQSVSWIWKVDNGVDTMDTKGKQEALRIEWCKARAQAHQWAEECLLLEEEMWQVVLFFGHKQACWLELASSVYCHVDKVTSDGLHAYATRQANLQGPWIIHQEVGIKVAILRAKNPNPI
ncbi:hypothetical protein C0991_003199 [Blastosporella zonata]|nr:hypothetical protein C0991_003199 [Blastosporella zonata]